MLHREMTPSSKFSQEYLFSQIMTSMNESRDEGNWASPRHEMVARSPRPRASPQSRASHQARPDADLREEKLCSKIHALQMIVDAGAHELQRERERSRELASLLERELQASSELRSRLEQMQSKVELQDDIILELHNKWNKLLQEHDAFKERLEISGGDGTGATRPTEKFQENVGSTVNVALQKALQAQLSCSLWMLFQRVRRRQARERLWAWAEITQSAQWDRKKRDDSIRVEGTLSASKHSQNEEMMMVVRDAHQPVHNGCSELCQMVSSLARKVAAAELEASKQRDRASLAEKLLRDRDSDAEDSDDKVFSSSVTAQYTQSEASSCKRFSPKQRPPRNHSGFFKDAESVVRSLRQTRACQT